MPQQSQQKSQQRSQQQKSRPANKQTKEHNYAFIDSQNLNLGIQAQGWKLDFTKFRKHLEQKYGVTKAYLFIGYMAEYQDMYTSLQEMGYVVVFKPVIESVDGEVKGNVDVELVMQAMSEMDRYDKAVIVSGDGDFASLVRYLDQKNKLEAIIVPNKYKYSALLKEMGKDRLDYMNNLRNKLEYKR